MSFAFNFKVEILSFAMSIVKLIHRMVFCNKHMVGSIFRLASSFSNYCCLFEMKEIKKHQFNHKSAFCVSAQCPHIQTPMYTKLSSN